MPAGADSQTEPGGLMSVVAMSPAQQQARVTAPGGMNTVGGATAPVEPWVEPCSGEIEVGGQAGLSVGLCMLSDDRQECRIGAQRVRPVMPNVHDACRFSKSSALSTKMERA